MRVATTIGRIRALCSGLCLLLVAAANGRAEEGHVPHPRLMALGAEPRGLQRNVSTQVRFSVSLQGVEAGPPAATLYRTDASGTEFERIGELADSHQPADLWFSGVFPIVTDQRLYFVAEATVGGQTLRSPVKEVKVGRFPVGLAPMGARFRGPDLKPGHPIEVSKDLLVIQFSWGVTEDAMEQIVKSHGARILYWRPEIDEYDIKIPEKNNMEELEAYIRELRKHKEICWVATRRLGEGRWGQP